MRNTTYEGIEQIIEKYKAAGDSSRRPVPFLIRIVFYTLAALAVLMKSHYLIWHH